MTHEQLIQIVEQRQTELETELSLNKQVLALLHGAPPRHPRPLRSGPIVYGNGHHDGKKPKAKSSGTGPGGARPHDPALTIRVRNVIEQALKKSIDGLTVAQMNAAVKMAGIEPTEHTAHNALRRLDVISKPFPTGSRGAKVYSLYKGGTK